MIKIKTSLIKDLTSKINKGIEGERTVRTSELLELSVLNNQLKLAVTNTQFYLSLDVPSAIESEENLHVTVDADAFIKLISKTTTDEIILEQKNGNLYFKGNGEYIFPIELDKDGNIKVLPTIDIQEEKSFEIAGDTLYSIYSFGSHELVNDVPVDNVQKYYYVDNEGAITYTESPYLNNFKINIPFKILINDRLAQLFSLFRGQKVIVGLSNKLENNLYQNKISFTSGKIKLVSYLPDNSIIQKYPASNCRQLQNYPYPGKVVINRVDLANALDRLNIFSTKDGNVVYKKAGKLNFTSDGLEIISVMDKNKELIPYIDKPQYSTYSCYMNLGQLLRHTKASNETNIELNYGNDLSIMFSKENYNQIIVEMEDPTETINSLGE
ncbi:hypothetical protein [uncultured Clostridium sp.]|uniref:hypothetical protein n=1 Tax=uncultured Clostridium sp. TaxID=59620 RepID=UPI00262CC292|nr:hypothetical protein [uncultured Clostridium sp.]